MLNYFSSIALQEKVISALVRLPQSLTANEREFSCEIQNKHFSNLERLAQSHQKESGTAL